MTNCINKKLLMHIYAQCGDVKYIGHFSETTKIIHKLVNLYIDKKSQNGYDFMVCDIFVKENTKKAYIIFDVLNKYALKEIYDNRKMVTKELKMLGYRDAIIDINFDKGNFRIKVQL